MNEIPDFLRGIDPDMVREMDHRMGVEIDGHFELQMNLFELDRQRYLSRLVDKMNAIDACLHTPDDDTLWQLNRADGLALLDFLYYIDQIFIVPESVVNRAYYLNEALSMADDAQSELNKHLTGSEYIYGADELRTKIANALSQDDQNKAKHDIVEMYCQDIHNPILRFVNER
jgi:hypothetical protein